MANEYANSDTPIYPLRHAHSSNTDTPICPTQTQPFIPLRHAHLYHTYLSHLVIHGKRERRRKLKKVEYLWTPKTIFGIFLAEEGSMSCSLSPQSAWVQPPHQTLTLTALITTQSQHTSISLPFIPPTHPFSLTVPHSLPHPLSHPQSPSLQPSLSLVLSHACPLPVPCSHSPSLLLSLYPTTPSLSPAISFILSLTLPHLTPLNFSCTLPHHTSLSQLSPTLHAPSSLCFELCIHSDPPPDFNERM